MSRRRRHNRGRTFVDLFACFLLPAYTLLFAGSVAWFGTNFSVLAVTGPDHYRGFVLWGLLAGGYFLGVLTSIARSLPPLPRCAVSLLSLLACGSLAVGLWVPYLPDLDPRWADLHVALCMTACVLLMAALLLALLVCLRREGRRYRPLLLAWAVIALGCGLLFLLAGIITTALEVWFTLTAALLARRLWQLRQKS